MLTYSELSMVHEQLALAPTLRSLDSIRINVVIQGNTKPGATDFPFLIKYKNRTELENTLENDPTVNDYELIHWNTDLGIYYIRNTLETIHISDIITAGNGFITYMGSKEKAWVVRVFLPDREALRTIWEYANEDGISIDIAELHEEDVNGDILKNTSHVPFRDMTTKQKSALKLAYQCGYFQEPREITLDEMADELGLSSTAVSSRLRRGIHNLIATTLSEEISQK